MDVNNLIDSCLLACKEFTYLSVLFKCPLVCPDLGHSTAAKEHCEKEKKKHHHRSNPETQLAMRTRSLLLVAAVVCATIVSPAAAEPYLCPWRTVAHVEDPFIQSLGKWAVEQQPALRFDKVESARAQGVGQCTSMTRNYDLVIDAANRVGAGDDKYRAVVFVTDFTRPQKLISFERISRP